MASIVVRKVRLSDFDQWLVLWQGYNEFYGRSGPTALDDEITKTTWARFFDPSEPIYCYVAEQGDLILGLVHFLFHRSSIQIKPNCYLQDLFTLDAARGKGVGRALIKAVGEKAKQAGSKRVYWQTHETNETAMKLYDQLAEKSGFRVYHMPLS